MERKIYIYNPVTEQNIPKRNWAHALAIKLLDS